MRLTVIRHGETFYNMAHQLTGQSDVPLSPLGIRQAQLVSDFLAGEHVDVIVSSDLERARKTARIIASPHDLPVEEDADIREISLGIWEGKTTAEIEVSEPELIALWRSNPSQYCPVGGETLIQVHQRLKRALDHWYARYPQGRVIWVSHGGVIGLLICHFLNIDLNHRRQFRHANASITEFLISSDTVTIEHLNETAFLRELETSSNADAGQ